MMSIPVKAFTDYQLLQYFAVSRKECCIRKEIVERIKKHGRVTEQDTALIDSMVQMLEELENIDSDLINQSESESEKSNILAARYSEARKQLIKRMQGEQIPEFSGVA